MEFSPWSLWMTVLKQKTSARQTQAFSSFCVIAMTSQILPLLPVTPGTMEADTETVSILPYGIPLMCFTFRQQCMDAACVSSNLQSVEYYILMHCFQTTWDSANKLIAKSTVRMLPSPLLPLSLYHLLFACQAHTMQQLRPDFCMPASAAKDASEMGMKEPGRYIQCFVYVRASPDDNFYAHPLDVVVVVELQTKRVLQWWHHKANPIIPTLNSNFHTKLVDQVSIHDSSCSSKICGTIHPAPQYSGVHCNLTHTFCSCLHCISS